MATLRRHRLILAVQDLEVSTGFWMRTLGFTRDFGDGSDGWSWLSRDGFAVGLGECANEPAASTLGDHSYVAYVTVDDVDALYDELSARGASMHSPPVTKPWGMREFAVRTPDGHRMTFGAEVSISQAILERPSWGERKFSFVHPPWMLSDFIERLRGTVPRLEALMLGVSEADAHRQRDGKWSIAQNIGHLSDVEELWQERLDDLRSGRKTYTPAAPARFQELAKRHQATPMKDIIGELEDRRTLLVDALANASPELQLASAFHERLGVPMRLVDCAQFYAEHDDHHLLRIRELRSHFSRAADLA